MRLLQTVWTGISLLGLKARAIGRGSFARQLALVFGLLGSLAGAAWFFETQNTQFTEISRKNQDNPAWSYFQLERSFRAISTLVRGPEPLEIKATKIAALWTVFDSYASVVTEGQPRILMSYPYQGPEAQNAAQILRQQFAQFLSAKQTIDTAIRNGWSLDAWNTLVILEPELTAQTSALAASANQSWNYILHTQQAKLENLYTNIQHAYKLEITVISLFALFAWIQLRSLQKTSTALETSNLNLRTKQIELEAHRTQLEAAFKARTFFIAKSSHELRTPLNGILGFLDLASSDPADPHHLTHIQHAQSAAQHLLTLTNDILSYSSMDSVAVTYSQWNLFDTIQECIALQQTALAKAGFVVDNGVPKNLRVNSDQARVKQVITNLLSNAIKYAPAHSPCITIVIRPDAPTGFIIIRVQDNGPGIPSEFQPLLFQPFTRAPQADPSIPGTGIGLSICKKIALALQGDLVLAPQEPGACFDFAFRSDTTDAPSAPACPHVQSTTPVMDLSPFSFLVFVKTPETHLHIKDIIEPLGGEIIQMPDIEFLCDIYSPTSPYWIITDQPEFVSQQIENPRLISSQSLTAQSLWDTVRTTP